MACKTPPILIYCIVNYFVWGFMKIDMYSNHSYIVKYLVIQINSTHIKVLEKRTQAIMVMYQVFAKYKMRTNGNNFKRGMNISSFKFYPLTMKSLLHKLKSYIWNDWACALVVCCSFIFCAVLIIVEIKMFFSFHILRRLPTITVNAVVKSSIAFNLTKFSE